MSRERISAQQTETTAAEQEQELTLAASHVVSDVSEVDDLLDEIDGLLAENAAGSASWNTVFSALKANSGSATSRTGSVG